MPRITLFLLIAVVIVFVFMKSRAVRSEDMKITRFAPVPNSPNCVSTDLPESDIRSMKPIIFQLPWLEAKEKLKSEIAGMQGASLVEDDGTYLHFTFKSRLIGFIDDVEFLIDEGSHTIRFRSGSRVGHSDLGANRKRMENVNQRLNGKI